MSHLRRRRNPQSLNPYSYARNNPLKYTDPSGHSIALAVLIAVGYLFYQALYSPEVATAPTSNEQVCKAEPKSSNLSKSMHEIQRGNISRGVAGELLTETTKGATAGVVTSRALSVFSFAPQIFGSPTSTERTANLTSNELGDVGQTLSRGNITQNGYNIVGEQVKANIFDGNGRQIGTRIYDFLAEKEGQLYNFESKVNSSLYGGNQQKFDSIVERYGGLSQLFGRNIPQELQGTFHTVETILLKHGVSVP